MRVAIIIIFIVKFLLI